MTGRLSDTVARLHGQGMLDREIAVKLGKGWHQIGCIRRRLGLKPHKRGLSGAAKIRQGKVYAFTYRCRQLVSDAEIAKLYAGQGYGR